MTYSMKEMNVLNPKSQISMDSFLLQSHQHQQQLLLQSNLMNPFSLSSKLTPKPKTLFSTSSPSFRYLCTTSQNSIGVFQALNGKSSTSTNATATSKATIQNLKENWLSSLSMNDINSNKKEENGGLEWVIGVDPDVSGALSLLKYDHSGCISAQVFDSPYVQVSIGKTRRKRLDAKSIVQLLQSFDAPLGTAAYLEQSIPFPQDGKLGWWSGGFGYGLWIGALVASGFSVVPVPSRSWKMEFELARSSSTKDDSRELAARLFPDLSSMLKRKKDHGRAEALLIAAYGKGHMTKADEVRALDDACEALSKL